MLFNMYCISFFTSPAIFILRESKKRNYSMHFFYYYHHLFYIPGIGTFKNKELLISSDIIVNDYSIRAVGANIKLERFYGDADSRISN